MMPHRRRRSRFVRRLTVFAPAAIVVVTGLLSYAALQRGLTSRQWVVHTRDVLDASTRIAHRAARRRDRRCADSSSRAIRRFSSHTRARRLAPTACSRGCARSRRTIRAQQRRVDYARRASRARVSRSSTRSSTSRSSPGMWCRGIVRGPGRQMMRDIRGLIDRIAGEEERLLVVARARGGARRAHRVRGDRCSGAIIAGAARACSSTGISIARSTTVARRWTRSRSANERLQEQAVELEAQADAAQVGGPRSRAGDGARASLARRRRRVGAPRRAAAGRRRRRSAERVLARRGRQPDHRSGAWRRSTRSPRALAALEAERHAPLRRGARTCRPFPLVERSTSNERSTALRRGAHASARHSRDRARRFAHEFPDIGGRRSRRQRARRRRAADRGRRTNASADCTIRFHTRAQRCRRWIARS